MIAAELKIRSNCACRTEPVSFVTQCFNWIKRGSFSSRIKTEENADHKANTEGKDY
jgi:hypothetical protein